MHRLSATELLDVWEQGWARSSSGRALVLLDAACPEAPGEAAQWTIGERDARLLTLREWIFGEEVTAVSACPECGGTQELAFRTPDVRLANAGPPCVPLLLEREGVSVEFRLPDSTDLIAAENETDGEAARKTLLTRCVTAAWRGGIEVGADELDPDIVQAVSRRMSEADPQAEIEFPLECAECHARWNEIFDIASFLWTEIQGWATRLLNEVHRLAAAYGWREADILAMSAMRRSIYLNLIAD